MKIICIILICVTANFGHAPVERKILDTAKNQLFLTNPSIGYTGRPSNITGWSYYAKKKVSGYITLSTWRPVTPMRYQLIGIHYVTHQGEGNCVVHLEKEDQWEVICNFVESRNLK